MGPKKNQGQNKWWVPIKFVKEKMSNKIFGPKSFQSERIFGPKEFCQNKFLSKKMFWPTNFVNIYGKKNLGPKIVD